MTCHTLKLPGGGVAIACARGPRERAPKCSATAGCGKPATLLCDGCDRALCPFCSVGPRAELDFCPTCFREAWRYWLGLEQRPDNRDLRRIAFRAWARDNPSLFLERCKPLTEAAMEVPQ